MNESMRCSSQIIALEPMTNIHPRKTFNFSLKNNGFPEINLVATIAAMFFRRPLNPEITSSSLPKRNHVKLYSKKNICG